MIESPLLAATVTDTSKLTYPCLATPKIDGIRALKIGGDIVTRQLKPIRNAVIRNILCQLLPDGSDGEITVGSGFADTTRAVMTAMTEFDQPFTFHWFDLVTGDAAQPYTERMGAIASHMASHRVHPQARIVPLYPRLLSGQAALTAFEEEAVGAGHEGVMVRAPGGRYKMGRATLKDGILLKLKRFHDDEAVIVGVEELQRQSAAGSKRKADVMPGGTLGSLRVTWKQTTFNLGTGFSALVRAQLWAERGSLVGKPVKFKYYELASQGAPRFPVFLGLRDVDDMPDR